MAKNNYGLGSRDMAYAGKIALNDLREKGFLSYASVDAMTDRFRDFSNFAKNELGIKKLEDIKIKPDSIRSYFNSLTEKNLSASTIQNRISAINTVMSHATGGAWERIGAVRDLGAPERSYIREDRAEISREQAGAAADVLRSNGLDRAAAVVQISRDLGLRMREASLLNVPQALREADQTGRISVVDGCKGGREREVVVTPEARETLAKLAENGFTKAIGDHQQLGSFINGELSQARDTLKDHGICGYHELRASWAQEKYDTLRSNGANDHAAREAVSHELGHNRIEITNAYIVR